MFLYFPFPAELAGALLSHLRERLTEIMMITEDSSMLQKRVWTVL
jgi:hypothetical protein